MVSLTDVKIAEGMPSIGRTQKKKKLSGKRIIRKIKKKFLRILRSIEVGI